jgi:hypothetical protein
MSNAGNVMEIRESIIYFVFRCSYSINTDNLHDTSVLVHRPVSSDVATPTFCLSLVLQLGGATSITPPTLVICCNRSYDSIYHVTEGGVAFQLPASSGRVRTCVSEVSSG